MKYKKILCCICMLFLFPLSTVSIRAYGTGEVPVLLEEEAEEDDGNDFIADALRSLDEKTAEEEAGENYITNFFNSAQTASSESFNIFKPETWIMTVINLFTMLLEMVGAVGTFFTMVLYNFVSSSFLAGIVNSVITGIEHVVFNWQDMNSWVIKVLVISTLIGIIYRFIKEFTHIRGYKQMLMIALSAVMSMTFVIFIGRNGRNIISGFENAVQSTIVETFVFDGEANNMEIANKESIFNTMQLQPFMLRHFGTTSYEQIASNAGQSVDDAKERVQELLDDPSTDNAEKEYDDFDNRAISHDIISSGVVFFLSLITLVHKVLIGIIIAVICIAVGAVKLMKELLLWLSIYQLIWWMIKRDHKAQQWFADRIMWSILAIGADLLFSTSLYFIMQMCTKVSAIHPLFLIGFDVLLLVIVLFAKRHISEIAAWLKDTGGDAIKTMLVGSTTPLQFYNNNRSRNSRFTADEAFDQGASDSDDGKTITDEDLSDMDRESDDPSGEDLSDKSEPNIDDNDEKTNSAGADGNDLDQLESETGDENLTEDEEKDHQEEDLGTVETDNVELSENDGKDDQLAEKNGGDYEDLPDEDAPDQSETENMNLSEEENSKSADDAGDQSTEELEDEDLSDKEEADFNDRDEEREAINESDSDQSETEASEVTDDEENDQEENNQQEDIRDESSIDHSEINNSSTDDQNHEDNLDKHEPLENDEADISVLETSDLQ